MNIHVVTSPCIGTKDGACAKVCPVECFYDAGEMLMIHPDECIGCGLCVAECPVAAIFPEEDLPAPDLAFIERAHTFFADKDSAALDSVRRK